MKRVFEEYPFQKNDSPRGVESKDGSWKHAGGMFSASTHYNRARRGNEDSDLRAGFSAEKRFRPKDAVVAPIDFGGFRPEAVAPAIPSERLRGTDSARRPSHRRFRPKAKIPYADVAHLVERHLAKVEVASSSLVIRSTGWYHSQAVRRGTATP